jgi:hypothetical protein
VATTSGPRQTTHTYHAEATVFEGKLDLPLVEKIEKQAYLKHNSQQETYLSQHAKDFKLEGVISYRSAYTQIAGNKGRKKGVGWTTLATSVIENLNILDVVTIDRVVSQIGVDHPKVGYVPAVYFLGTRFDNFRISGKKVEVDIDLDFLGKKPAGDQPYTEASGFMEKVADQHRAVRKHSGLIKELSDLYPDPDDAKPTTSKKNTTERKAECTLVKSITLEPGVPGSVVNGHIIYIPGFGWISLANLELVESDYKPGTTIPRKTLLKLRMLHFHWGCSTSGHGSGGVSVTNGITMP